MNRRNAAGPRRGFTLIELIVVTMILALLVTIGFPALQNQIRRSKMMGIAREATNGLRLARFQAIKNSRPTVYSIDPATRDLRNAMNEDRRFSTIGLFPLGVFLAATLIFRIVCNSTRIPIPIC